MTVYRSIEAFAVKEYGIRPIRFTMPKTEQKQLSVLDYFERKRLEQYLLCSVTNSNLAVLLCLFTGLRIGELCALQWGDIDFRSGLLSVTKTVQRITRNKKSQLVMGSPKSKTSERVVPIPAFLQDILLQKKKDDNTFISSGTSKPTDPRTMQNRFQKILKQSNVRKVNFHLLRHTYATVCIENGFDPKTLSELLGHANANITLNRYVHSSMDLKKTYVSRLTLSA